MPTHISCSLERFACARGLCTGNDNSPNRFFSSPIFNDSSSAFFFPENAAIFTDFHHLKSLAVLSISQLELN